MDILGGSIVLISILIIIICDIYIIIKAFKVSLLWGFGTLIIPIVALAFIVLHWTETKKYVFWMLIGLLLFLIGGSLYNLRWEELGWDFSPIKSLVLTGVLFDNCRGGFVLLFTPNNRIPRQSLWWDATTEMFS